MHKVVFSSLLTISDVIKLFHKSISTGIKIKYTIITVIYHYFRQCLETSLFPTWRDSSLLYRNNYAYDFPFQVIMLIFVSCPVLLKIVYC